jgi:biotin carboxylase
MQRTLILALSNWIGAARFPRALQRAGFEVAVLCPASTRISHTKFVNRRMEFGPSAHVREIIAALWQTIAEWGATSVIASDDRSIRFVEDVATAVHEGKLDHQPGKPAVAAALSRSMALPEHWETIRRKSLCHSVAEALGIPAPPQVIVNAEDDALAFAKQHGFPIVLKADSGAAGTTVSTCRDESEVRSAYQRLAASSDRGLHNPILAEGYVPGPEIAHCFVADRGRIITGLTRLKVHCHPAPFGPSSVVQIVDYPQAADAAGRFAAHVQYCGFASMQFIVDAATQTPKFLEFNARPLPMQHMDEDLCGVDFGKAWHAVAAGSEPPQFRGPIIGRTIALFPQEWMRDPASKYLKPDEIVDVPWDDPPLLRAYLQQSA